MTGTPNPPAPIVTTGIEHTLVPTGGPSPTEINGSWQSVTFSDLPESITLNGFKVHSRYYVETCTPSSDTDGNEEETCIRSYPAWNLISQTLVKSSPSRQVFDTDNGTELYTASPGVYGYATSGITDGTKYEYYRVFNQSDISYIPRASTINQPPIRQPETLPEEDENGCIMDTLTSFLPDPRELVTITYTLTTNYGGGSDVFEINHTVFQNLSNVSAKIEGYLSKSYFSRGQYHVQLHEMDEVNLYDSGGNLVRPDRYKPPVYEGTKLTNTLSDVTPEDIIKTQMSTNPKDLTDLINMIDDYEYPV